jgi:hypothetical protein
MRNTIEEEIQFIDEKPLPQSMHNKELYFTATMRDMGLELILITH